MKHGLFYLHAKEKTALHEQEDSLRRLRRRDAVEATPPKMQEVCEESFVAGASITFTTRE
jgi:hypothetical protein